MIVQVVTIPVKPDMKDEFYAAVHAAVAASLAEEGVNVYSPSWKAEEGESLVLVEEYADQDAFDAHYAADHTKAFFRAVGKSAAGQVEVRKYEVSDLDVQLMGG